MIWLLLAAAQPTPAPDIQLELRAEAREVRTEVDGEAWLTVRAAPDGGSAVRTVRTPEGGAAVQRNVRVVTRAEARIADPLGAPSPNVTNEVNPPEQPPEQATQKPDLR